MSFFSRNYGTIFLSCVILLLFYKIFFNESSSEISYQNSYRCIVFLSSKLHEKIDLDKTLIDIRSFISKTKSVTVLKSIGISGVDGTIQPHQFNIIIDGACEKNGRLFELFDGEINYSVIGHKTI